MYFFEKIAPKAGFPLAEIFPRTEHFPNETKEKVEKLHLFFFRCKNKSDWLNIIFREKNSERKSGFNGYGIRLYGYKIS